MRSAASRIEPVRATSSNKSALPGPKATTSPQLTRNRGSNFVFDACRAMRATMESRASAASRISAYQNHAPEFAGPLPALQFSAATFRRALDEAEFAYLSAPAPQQSHQPSP